MEATPTEPRRARLLASLVAAGAAALALAAPAASAETYAPGFSQSPVFSGLDHPTAVRFAPAPDQRVFVAEKRGVVKEFDSLTATTPTVVADISTEVDDYWDRGLLGLAVDPSFPARPYLYLLYAYDAPIGGTAPTWNDTCPDPPGALGDGCVVSGRLTRIQVDPATNQMVPGSERVLIEDWCQQYPSHSVGDLTFGADGALYVSGGEGATWTFADYGQGGGTHGDPPVTPANPCGDPPVGVGGQQTPPTAEGGSLRAQSYRISDGPARLSGALLRVDPNTGLGLPDNPSASRPDANGRRIVAYGLRNPFRITQRPGSDEIWVANVGQSAYEDIDRVHGQASAVTNFGWPCYEGPDRQPGWDALDVNLCESLYADPAGRTAPYYSYAHNVHPVADDNCSGMNGSSISGVAFENGSSYPSAFAHALFFADHTRNCIWAMQAGADGLPDPSRIVTIDSGANNPVDLQSGPGGDIFYVDYEGGAVRRLRYRGPHASASADHTYGAIPLTVAFSSSGSTGSGTLSYHWDFGDGTTSDSASPTHVYTTSGRRSARLTVTDSTGASAADSVTVYPGDTPPSAQIDSPSTPPAWAVGDRIAFSGSATDGEDASLPDSAFRWAVVIHHCVAEGACHTHEIEEIAGRSGSFTAPDHEYPSYLELTLTVTDSMGMTDTRSIRLDPRTAALTMQSSPAGAQLGLDLGSAGAPFTRTVIAGSAHSVSAPSPQAFGADSLPFGSWSDGGAETHNITVDKDTTLTAQFGTPPGDGGSPATMPPAEPPAGDAQPPVAAQPAPLVVGQPAAVLPLPIRGLRLAPGSLRPGRVARIRFSLARSATVSLAFEQLVRRAGRSRFVPLRRAGASSTLLLYGVRGPNSIPFAGRVGGRMLAAGRYRMVVRSVAGTAPATPVSAAFRVLAATH